MGFSPELGWTSTEYPLLLPLAVARLWAYAGETTLAPVLLAKTFTICAPPSLAAAVAGRGAGWCGAIAALLLLGTPGWASLGGIQYADVPLAALMVAAVGTIVGASPVRGRLPAGHLAAAGFLLGLGGWTKNEGVAAAAIVVAIHGVASWRATGPRSAARGLVLLLAGSLGPAIAWLTFHQLVMPRVTGVLFMGHTTATVLQRLGDGHRWETVLRGIVQHLPGYWVGLPLFVAAVAAVLALRERALPRNEALPIAGSLLLLHVDAFMLTNWDLDWHIRLAADWLLLQALPLVLLGLFALELPPDPRTPLEHAGSAGKAPEAKTPLGPRRSEAKGPSSSRLE